MRRQKKTIVKRIAAVGMGLCMSMSMCMTGYASDANSVSIAAETSVSGDAMITPARFGENTETSTTFDVGNNKKMTVFYQEAVRYKDEEGQLIDYDPSLTEVE